jgi:hypothetical protein
MTDDRPTICLPVIPPDSSSDCHIFSGLPVEPREVELAKAPKTDADKTFSYQFRFFKKTKFF